MKRPVIAHVHGLFLFSLALSATAQRARAEIVYSVPSVEAGTTGTISRYSNNGTPPISFTYNAALNGITDQTIFDSAYSLTSTSTGPFVQTSLSSETMNLDVGGQSPPGSQQSAGLQGLMHVVSYLNYPGTDEYFFASQFGSLSYHLAAGDTLTYSVFSQVYGQGSLDAFQYNLTSTTNTPGDFRIDLTVQPTYLFDLVQLNGAAAIISDFLISATITRGSATIEDSTVDFDPEVTLTGLSVPEPSTLQLFLTGIPFVCGFYLRDRRGHKASSGKLA